MGGMGRNCIWSKSSFCKTRWKHKKIKEERKEKGVTEFNTVTQLRKDLGMPITEKNWNEYTSINPKTLKMVHSLKNLKESCWYLGWNDKNWVSFSRKYPKKTQRIVCNCIIMFTKWNFYRTILGYKYPTLTTDSNSEIVKQYKKDKLFIKAHELEKKILSKKIQKDWKLVLPVLNS